MLSALRRLSITLWVRRRSPPRGLTRPLPPPVLLYLQVQWALEEDELDGALLTPRMRRLRVRGGAQQMIMGYNADHLDSEFSVVSVR